MTTTDPTPKSLKSYLSAPRFTNHITLPASPTHGRDAPFNLSYADFGYRNEEHPEKENVLLFFGPLMGARLLHVAKDELARKHRVRVIHPDRPGFGSTDDVTTDKRLLVWRGVMIDLLQHLNIKHVSLFCHSAGTLYLLDLLLHHPEILHPTRPYASIGAPWVLPSHSGITTLTLAKSLPNGLISQVDKLVSFVNKSVIPVMGTSIDYTQAFFTMVSGGAKEPPAPAFSNEATRFEAALFQRIIDVAYAEGVHGLSPETLLVLQNAQGGDGGWADWGDVDKLAPRLTEALRGANRRLALDVYFAETDGLIGDAGTKGPLWFEKCWKSETAGGMIDYTSTVVPGADHDMIWLLKWGAIQKVFEKVGSPVGEDGEGEA